MAESNAESRVAKAADFQTNSQVASGAQGRSGPGLRAGSDRLSGAPGPAGLGLLSQPSGGRVGPPGLARGWVVVAPGGVPAAVGEPLAALLGGLLPPRRWLPRGLGDADGALEVGAAGWGDARADGQAQSSRKSSDSGLAGGEPAWADPQGRLAALAQEPGPWLWPLAPDPGAFLGERGSWAEALGAWRQPCLLLIPAAAAATGPAAAYCALLQGQGVPLLGLIQWGGPWLAVDRRRDGLPWLGWLAIPRGEDLKGEDPRGEDPRGEDPQGPDPQGPDPQAASDPDQDPAGQNQAWEAAADLARALQLASHRLDLD